MLVELQIDSARFCQSFQEQVRRQLACYRREVQLGPIRMVIVGYDVGLPKLQRSPRATGTGCVYNEFNTPTNIPVRAVQLVLPLGIKLCAPDAVIAANGAACQPILAHTELVFEVAMDSCGSRRNLCFTLVKTTPTEVMDALDPGMKQRCLLLPLDRILAQALPEGMDTLNAHLALSQDGRTLAVRMEMWNYRWHIETGEMPRPASDWTRFTNGVFADHLRFGGKTRDWSVFVDGRALASQVRRLLEENLAENTGIRLHAGPSAVWRNDWGVWAVNAHFNLDKLNACRCFTKEIDVNADVHVRVVTVVPRDNVVRQDVYIDVDPDFWDAACCTITTALFWPIVGAEQFAKQNINQGQYLLGFLPFVALIGASLEFLNASEKMDPPTGFTKDDDDGSHLFREQPVDPGSDPNFGTLTLQEAVGVDDSRNLGTSGILLSGALTLRPATEVELADIGVDNFTWGAAARCSRQLAARAMLSLTTAHPGHWALLRVCEVRVLDDPLGVFSQGLKWGVEPGNRIWVAVNVDIWSFPPAYWDAPYPCRVLIVTNGGLRIVTLDPPPRLSADEAAALTREIQFQFVNNCYLPKHRIFEELEWPINPLLQMRGRYAWQLQVAGLPADQQLQVTDERGESLARFTVNALGVASLSLLADYSGEGVALRVLRQDAHRAASTRSSGSGDMKDSESDTDVPNAEDAEQGVVVRQTLLIPRARIDPGGPVAQMALDTVRGASTLVVVTPWLAQEYDVSTPAAPVLRAEYPGRGLRGALRYRGELWLWGATGLRRAGEAGGNRALAPCETTPVQGATTAGGRLFVLQDGVVRVLDGACEVGRLDTPGALYLAAAGNRLAVATEDVVEVFDITTPHAPQSLARAPLAGVTTLLVPPALRHGAFFYALTVEGGKLLEVLPTSDLVEVGHYERDAWFARAAILNRTVALLAEDGAVEVYEVGDMELSV